MLTARQFIEIGSAITPNRTLRHVQKEYWPENVRSVRDALLWLSSAELGVYIDIRDLSYVPVGLSFVETQAAFANAPSSVQAVRDVAAIVEQVGIRITWLNNDYRRCAIVGPAEAFTRLHLIPLDADSFAQLSILMGLPQQEGGIRTLDAAGANEGIKTMLEGVGILGGTLIALAVIPTAVLAGPMFAVVAAGAALGVFAGSGMVVVGFWEYVSNLEPPEVIPASAEAKPSIQAPTSGIPIPAIPAPPGSSGGLVYGTPGPGAGVGAGTAPAGQPSGGGSTPNIIGVPGGIALDDLMDPPKPAGGGPLPDDGKDKKDGGGFISIPLPW